MILTKIISQNFFFIKDYNKQMIRSVVEENKISDMSKEEITLCKHIVKIINNEQITRGTSESNTDSFVNYLLNKFQLDEYPFLLRIQPNYKFYVGDQEIISNPEFSIEKDNHIVFIDEDKHINNIGSSKDWGENQIAGEMLAVASTNYNNNQQKLSYDYNIASIDNKDAQIIHSMRVIGTRFTFYKSVISTSYLKSLGEGLPSENITIYRYPNNKKEESFSHYDYIDPKERKIIVNILWGIKDYI